MPQYDTYEDPRPTMPTSDPVTDHKPPRSPLRKGPVNKSLTACHDEGINKPSDTDTPEIDPTSPPLSPYRFHRRHSLLSRQESPTESLTRSFSVLDPSTSPENPSPAERDQLTKFERSQRQDDNTRTISKSDERHAENTADQRREQDRIEADPEAEFRKENHLLKGGWMHRSRASFDALQDRRF